MLRRHFAFYYSSALAMAALLGAVGCQNAATMPPVTTVSSVDAQYVAFYSAAKAYVSAEDYSGSTGGIYSFAPGPASPKSGQALLYMTDTYSGKVYSCDPTSRPPAESATSIAATRQNATGEIAFYKGIGYVSVGAGAAAGVYRFNPTDAQPSFGMIKTYTPVSGTIGKNFQEIIEAKGLIYAADNTDAAVLILDPADDAILATIHASASGTTGLVAGIYGGLEGVFVANTGGSLDFIRYGAADGSTAQSVAANSTSVPFYPGRVIQLPNGNLMATGYQPDYSANHTYLVTLASSGATVTELMYQGHPFGSLDLAFMDDLVFVPSGDYSTKTSLIYVMDETGAQESYSPITVMDTGTDLITNLGVYQD